MPCTARGQAVLKKLDGGLPRCASLNATLIDRARERLGGSFGWVVTTLVDGDRRLAIDSAEEAIALEAALTKLENIDARAARVVELRHFAGLALEQDATSLGLARRTIDRDWVFARAFLHAELG